MKSWWLCSLGMGTKSGWVTFSCLLLCRSLPAGPLLSREICVAFPVISVPVMQIVDGFGGEADRSYANMDLQADMLASMEWAYTEIKRIQTASRSGNPIDKPQFPMLILRSPKGWTGPATVDGKVVEGSFRSHQVPAKDCKSNPKNLKVLQDWLRKYRVGFLTCVALVPTLLWC